MLYFKNGIKLLIILLITFFFGLVFLEIYASINNHKFPSYSWQSENIMDHKIKNCKKKTSNIIGVFGDSAVEYHGENSSNIVQQLDKKFKNYSLCNFGIAGTEPTVYINRFLFALENDIVFDKAIFYFYEGNDFSSFRHFRNTKDFKNTSIGSVKGILEYNSQLTLDRKLSFIKKFVKSTYAINIVYRELFKKYFLTNRINDKFVKKIYDRGGRYYEVPIKNAIERMKSTPDEVKRKFSSDLFNVNVYKLALRNPNYYSEIHRPELEDYKVQKKIAFHHLDFINSLCKENSIDCKFIIVPCPVFLFDQSKEIWQNTYRFNYYPEYGASSIVSDLEFKYNNFFYPDGVLEQKDYIYADMHLTGEGNRKLAEFTYEKF